MPPMSLELTEGQRRFLADRAAASGLPSPEAAALALIDQARRAEFVGEVLAGVGELDRGEGKPMSPADWDRLRADVAARLDPAGAD